MKARQQLYKKMTGDQRFFRMNEYGSPRDPPILPPLPNCSLPLPGEPSLLPSAIPPPETDCLAVGAEGRELSHVPPEMLQVQNQK